MKMFLLTAEKTGLEGKPGGAFGSYTHDFGYKHDSYAPAIIFNILQSACKMKSFELGPFTLKEDVIETSEGMRTCQDYGRIFAEKPINQTRRDKMLKLNVNSKSKPGEVIKKALEFFGPSVYGLKVTDQTDSCVYFEGGGGGIEVSACPGDKGTSVDIETRERENQIKEFARKIK